MKPEDMNLSSEQAAALWLSDGATDDPAKAVNYDTGVELNLDKLARAAIRRRLGFDFTVQILPNVILVTASEDARLRTRCKVYKGDLVDTPSGPAIGNQATINRLVEACTRLKAKWDEKYVR